LNGVVGGRNGDVEGTAGVAVAEGRVEVRWVSGSELSVCSATASLLAEVAMR
jgi:hypothetical protein